MLTSHQQKTNKQTLASPTLLTNKHMSLNGASQGHWERRIVELGGPDYAKTAPKITDSEGNEVQDSRGPGYR